MKYLCLLSLLLVSCVQLTSTKPWNQPSADAVICNAEVCCYPTSERTQMCVANGLFNNNPNGYFLLVKY